MAEGVDLSRHQSSIDWQAARDGGIEFAYVKLTEGTGYADPRADAHVTAARNAGTTVGGYHFARPDTPSNTPEHEAQDFAHALKTHGLAGPGFLPPCLDMEKPAALDLIDWSRRFITTLRAETGYQPIMIYASSSWWKGVYHSGDWLDEHMWSWVAHYGRPPGQPGFKNDRTVMHQYTSSGRIAGYRANIDRNTCWVDLATLTQGTPGGGPPPFPLQRGHYFGLISGPAQSHGGYYPNERPYVKLIQQALQRKGYAPNWPTWADGLYEQPTYDAVAAWQHDHMPGTRYYGQVWADDWAALLS